MFLSELLKNNEVSQWNEDSRRGAARRAINNQPYLYAGERQIREDEDPPDGEQRGAWRRHS
jgi:hypothetical protein